MDGTLSGSVPSSVDIGRAFVRQYYTMLSERPEEAFRYYGKESVLSHDGGTALGPEDIQKTIDEIAFHDSKFRIYSIQGSSTLADGIVLQVIGEISLHNKPRRKFAQTFVLGQQQAKKFYVQNDIFMYHDKAFDNDGESQGTVTDQIQSTKLNGHLSQNESSPKKNLVASAPLKSFDDSASYVKIPQKEHIEVVEEEKPKPEKPKVEQPAEPSKPPASQVPSAPKTWATLVGGAAPKPDPAPVAPPKSQVSAINPAKETARQQPSQRDSSQQQDAGNRKIFVSNIIRHTDPSDFEAPAEELKKFFSTIGEVESVHVPIKILDLPRNKAAYAFLTMKTSRDVKKVIDAAVGDERGYKTLKVSVPSFGFDDFVNVSEQKEQYQPQRNGGFQKRGGFQNNNRGYGNRGGVAGFRGGRGGRGGQQSHN